MSLPECNPILLFELRQLVRNRFVVWLMLLYLAVLVLFMGSVMLEQGSLFGVNDEQGRNAATGLLVIYYGFTSAATLGFAVFKTAGDRLRESPVYFTTLSPWRTAWGKFLFGLVFALLFLCMTLPFFSVVYLLRGVDLYRFLFGLFTVSSSIISQYLYVIVFLSGARTVGRLVGLSLPLAAILLSFFGSSSMFIYHCLSVDVYGRFFVNQLALTCWGVGVMLLLATAQMSPETSNRMFPLRLTLTITQIVFAALFCGSGFFVPLSATSIAYLLNGYFWTTFPQFFAVFICEREVLSHRQRKTIPTTLRGRLLAFPLYTGAANAMVWCFLALTLEIVTIGIAYLVNALFRPSALSDEDTLRATMSSFSYGLLFLDYCATWLLLYQLILYRLFSRYWNWIVPFCILMVGHFAFYLVILGGAGPLEWIDTPWFPLCRGHISSHDAWYITVQYAIAICWAMFLLGIGAPWIRRSFQAFKRESADEPIR